MAILIPLAFLRKLHSLRHTSYIALFSVGLSCLTRAVDFILLTRLQDILWSS